MSEEQSGAPGTSIVAAGQKIGYRNPPAQNRYQKGQSSNPKGRPKRAKAQPRSFDPAAKPTDGLILEEAYGPVTIREGEKTVELPAIQAAMRALAISAMKGSRLSQKALAEIVREVEQRHSADHFSALENAFEYKQKWTAELQRRERLGITEPDPIPHPDDISINLRTGHVRTEGPLDEAEKKDWSLREWHFEQRIFDIINDSLPKRYKAKLENRSYAEGASREGKAIDELRKNKSLQQEYVGE